MKFIRRRLKLNNKDCIYFGEVKIRPLISVDACKLDYIKWCKFGCDNCKNYNRKENNG